MYCIVHAVTACSNKLHAVINTDLIIDVYVIIEIFIVAFHYVNLKLLYFESKLQGNEKLTYLPEYIRCHSALHLGMINTIYVNLANNWIEFYILLTTNILRVYQGEFRNSTQKLIDQWKGRWLMFELWMD